MCLFPNHIKKNYRVHTDWLGTTSHLANAFTKQPLHPDTSHPPFTDKSLRPSVGAAPAANFRVTNPGAGSQLPVSARS